MSKERWQDVNFEVLKGKTVAHIHNSEDELVFVTSTGEIYRQKYYQDCCAMCSIEEIHGDLKDIIGSEILMAEEVSNRGDSDDHLSETWTFYKAATIKGAVTVRWYGSSNGYYSEAPSFEKLVTVEKVEKDRGWDE